MTDIAAALKVHLVSLAALLYPRRENPEEARAGRRVDALAAAAPVILCLFAEPWLGQVAERKRHWQILMQCASLHLYSRVLDDAVDEGMACCQTALLRAQHLFFEAVFRLGSLVPDMGAPGMCLIKETTDAVIAEDASPSERYWGSKNHHLLLIPLFLSGDERFFSQVRNAFSASLALLQATDELKQGSCLDKAVYCRLVQQTMDEALPALEAYGWKSLCQKLCMESRRLLRMLENIEA